MSYEITNRIAPRSDWEEIVAPIQGRYPGSGRNLKWVLLALADAANPDDGACWLSVGTICTWTMLTERSVQRALAQAVALRLLKIMPRKNRSSIYVFNLDALPIVERTRPGKEKSPFDFMRSAEPDLFTGATGADDEEHPRQGGTPPPPVTTTTPARVAPKPLYEPLEEPSDSGDFEKSPDRVDDGPPLQTVDVGQRPSGMVLATKRQKLEQYVEEQWHELKLAHPGIADIRRIDDGLAKQITDRAKAHARDGESFFDVWQVVFAEIGKSPFLQGRAPPGQGRDKPFKLSLGWLCRPGSFREVINGKYSDDQSRRTSAGDPMGRAATTAINAFERRRGRRAQSGGDPGVDDA